LTRKVSNSKHYKNVKVGNTSSNNMKGKHNDNDNAKGNNKCETKQYQQKCKGKEGKRRRWGPIVN
jgi:hypothetical protein